MDRSVVQSVCGIIGRAQTVQDWGEKGEVEGGLSASRFP